MPGHATVIADGEVHNASARSMDQQPGQPGEIRSARLGGLGLDAAIEPDHALPERRQARPAPATASAPGDAQAKLHCGVRRAHVSVLRAHPCERFCGSAFSNGAMMSIGSGKTIVEFLSAAITVRVSRYLS